MRTVIKISVYILFFTNTAFDCNFKGNIKDVCIPKQEERCISNVTQATLDSGAVIQGYANLNNQRCGAQIGATITFCAGYMLAYPNSCPINTTIVISNLPQGGETDFNVPEGWEKLETTKIKANISTTDCPNVVNNYYTVTIKRK